MTDANGQVPPADEGRLDRRVRPAGRGLGQCPRWAFVSKQSFIVSCCCGEPPCARCGQPKHCALHMHCAGEAPGDPPFDHEYEPKTVKPQTGDGYDVLTVSAGSPRPPAWVKRA